MEKDINVCLKHLLKFEIRIKSGKNKKSSYITMIDFIKYFLNSYFDDEKDKLINRFPSLKENNYDINQIDFFIYSNIIKKDLLSKLSFSKKERWNMIFKYPSLLKKQINIY
jgi:hypothetical protein